MGEDPARLAVAAEARQGRLTAQPPHRPRSDFTAGLERLKVDGGTGGLLYVPAGVRPERPAPLVLLFHGAGATAQHGLNLLIDQADDAGPVLLAPNSQGRTWDLLLGGYGPDVARVDQALAETLQRLPVDPTRLAIGGFSDGASYAVSLGLTNGNLFSHVLAFSPGFAAPATRRGRPHVFVSHGTRDRVLPIDTCSRRLVPELRQAGYDVRYREFDGGHAVPAAIARDAVGWLRSPTA
jgi:phospholipase/carboxylesterase